MTWLTQPGETVARGDIIAVVHTDKADVEVEVFTSGVLERVLVEPGAEVPVGTVLAVIREDGAPAPPSAAPAAPPIECGRPAHRISPPRGTSQRSSESTRL
jgi:pyruvate dehydrogenase E2 component (dihydrolipoamide acetyltransferase)